MFVSDQRVLPVSLGAARARLANLVHGGWLCGASETVYQSGVEYLRRAGRLGDVPGVPRLVRVQFLDPVDRGNSVTMAMRWEVPGVTGGLFPVLDANIALATEGGEGTRITLTAVYRPAGALGVLLHRAAAATIYLLMTNLATALQGADAAPADADAPAWWEPGLKKGLPIEIPGPLEAGSPGSSGRLAPGPGPSTTPCRSHPVTGRKEDPG